MRFTIHTPMLSLRTRFDILDEAGQVAYTAFGRRFVPLDKKIRVCDASGAERAMVRWDGRGFWYPLAPQIDRDGRLAATIKFGWPRLWRHNARLLLADGNTLELSIAGWGADKLTFLRAGQSIAKARRRTAWFRYIYEVDVCDGEDQVLILACVLCMHLAFVESAHVGLG